MSGRVSESKQEAGPPIYTAEKPWDKGHGKE